MCPECGRLWTRAELDEPPLLWRRVRSWLAHQCRRPPSFSPIACMIGLPISIWIFSYPHEETGVVHAGLLVVPAALAFLVLVPWVMLRSIAGRLAWRFSQKSATLPRGWMLARWWAAPVMLTLAHVLVWMGVPAKVRLWLSVDALKQVEREHAGYPVGRQAQRISVGWYQGQWCQLTPEIGGILMPIITLGGDAVLVHAPGGLPFRVREQLFLDGRALGPLPMRATLVRLPYIMPTAVRDIGNGWYVVEVVYVAPDLTPAGDPANGA